jgi:hypothetical protein
MMEASTTMKRMAVVACCFLVISCSRSSTNRSAAVTAAKQSPASELPFMGFVDIPAVGASLSKQMDIGGWALWGEGLRSVDILIDGQPTGAAIQINVARPDVARVHPEYGNPAAGWGGRVDISQIPAGKHTVTVRASSNTGNTRDVQTFAILVR